MDPHPTRTRAALLLTNRLVPLDAKPLTAREFWQLVERVDPGALLTQDAAAIAELAGVDATRPSAPQPARRERPRSASSRNACSTGASR